MKLVDYIYFGVISIFTSISAVVLYDALIITPELKSCVVKVVDIERILEPSERAVKENRLGMEAYKNRIAWLEKAVTESSGVTVSKYIRINDGTYPVIFGGRDMTDYFLKHVETIE